MIRKRIKKNIGKLKEALNNEPFLPLKDMRQWVEQVSKDLEDWESEELKKMKARVKFLENKITELEGQLKK